MTKTFIVGILNTTPDSYFDGGKFESIESAVKRAGEMLEEGADIIEIGGESTGPGSKEVSEEEETSRTIEIIKAIKEKYPEAKLSIDTYKSSVAKLSIDAGVAMVNDVTAGRGDPKMFQVISNSDVKYVIMFSKDEIARTTINNTQYDDVTATIKKFLNDRMEIAIKSGVSKDSIILDPSLGHFVSSDSKYSFEIIKNLNQFKKLGCPIFVSPSRKSFLAGSENLPTKDRLPSTIVSSAIAVLNGATYIRTHDVAEVRRGCEMASYFLDQ
ncbi:MAG: dihydropteroate synthase [Candidatus Peribacteraceae bacterium]|nr:dihydropteroate synthase [Candidatus Peribacteraceae bacterium]